MEETTKTTKEACTECVEIHSVSGFLDHVLSSSREGKYIFRGQASESWELKPSIGRRSDYSEELEKDFFLQFKMKYWTYTSERPKSDMDLLFLAQHYGLPTRLIDWSYNPLIALYFACCSNDDEDGCIYMFPLTGAKIMESDGSSKAPKTIDDIFSLNDSRFVIPDYTDVRYKNQKALFLLCNEPSEEFIFAKKSVIVKANAKKKILNDLALLGYDKTMLFPTLDSLCEDIKGK